jgi:hypothetical protein
MTMVGNVMGMDAGLVINRGIRRKKASRPVASR